MAKAIAEKKEKTIKYEDKSTGQPELVPIFEAIKTLISKYDGKGTLKATGEGKAGGQYNVVSFKHIEVAGKKTDNIYFASALVQKGFVGFYYFPIYVCEEAKPFIQPELQKLLKGKTCFHIKKNDPLIMKQIEQALKDGFALYKKLGWV